MLWFSLGLARLDTIRNECIIETAQVEWFGNKAREARPKWARAEDGYWIY